MLFGVEVSRGAEWISGWTGMPGSHDQTTGRAFVKQNVFCGGALNGVWVVDRSETNGSLLNVSIA